MTSAQHAGRRALALATTFVAGAALGAQQPRFRAAIDAVRLDVLATDHGRPIGGLTGANFEVLDNGVRQQIQVSQTSRLPLDVILVFDTSASVRGTAMEQLKLAAEGLLDSLNESDRVALWTFSSAIAARHPLTHDFSSARQAVHNLEGGGATSMLDCLSMALVSRTDTANRSLALLFSDGKDNRSWLSEDDVVQAAGESGTVVYAVAFNPSVELAGDAERVTGAGPDKRVLEKIANETGGRLLWADRDRDLKLRFLEILEEMRTRYVLTYRHASPPARGWHAVNVRLIGRPGTARTRSGYFVGG